MGNHYHLLVWMEPRQEMSKKQLMKRAKLLYNDTLLKGWLKHNWERFEERIFDVSELMRSLQSKIATWYNYSFNRRGRFWADRFKSTIIEDHKAAMDCLIYIELNPVRAGIVQRPEDYEGSSIFFRDIKKDKWMLPLTSLTGHKSRGPALKDLKSRIYYRGFKETKEGHAKITAATLKEEERNDFDQKGIYTKKIRYFADGVVIGSDEFVKEQLNRLIESGKYLRRKKPIPLENGIQMLRAHRGSSA